MEQDTVKTITIFGDLSMGGVREQFSVLAQQLDSLQEAYTTNTAPISSCTLDLTGVQALDACGCQLLVAFLHTLVKRGTTICSLMLNDDYRDKIRSLGFGNELCAGKYA